jgi:hypothetical protein
MLTNKEIKEKAERSYKDFLLSVLRREVFFPCHIKGNKGNASMPLQELYPALSNLIEHSKEKTGFGYTVTYKEVNTRHSGIITLPDEVFFVNPTDFLRYIDKETDFLAFRKAVETTKKRVPSILQWVEDNPLKLQKYATDWESIVTVIHYFLQNPRPNCYWQQLPIDVDLVDVAQHQPLIGEILATILPYNVEEMTFEARFGLRYDEPMLRFRFLETEKDIAYPLSHCRFMTETRVFFITDKSVFLTFPQIPDSVAIYWEHAPAASIKIPHIQQKKCYFTADISAKGFEQLAEMRHYLPNLQSILMDKTTFDAFAKHHDTIKHSASPTFLHHLTRNEYDFYQFLTTLPQHNALMQRKIAYHFLKLAVCM